MFLLSDLPLDIKTMIAIQHQETWILLYLYDDQFHNYSKTLIGKLQFIESFTESFTEQLEDDDNTVTNYKLFGKLHRINDLPAAIYSDGDRRWYQHGKLHRDNDLPAVKCDNGTQFWYRYDKLHRDNDLPAVIYSDGSQVWYQNGIKYNPQ